ncbi:MAG: uroporphyrinogen decarboxylase family protein [Spirochaetia bacterium]
MPSRRDRVMTALDFKVPDAVPKDLGGMRSTGISAFAYPKLRAALKLPARPPKMYDTSQMLALPDLDVLDALDCDVAHVTLAECTNAFEEPGRWTPYDFNGRLPALVMNPGSYVTERGGTIVQDLGGVPARMPPASFVFDIEHAGEILDLDAEIREPDYARVESDLAAGLFTEEQARSIGAYCGRVRASTDRAVFFNGLQIDLGFPGGMAAYSMMCVLHPQWARELHQLKADHARRQVKALLPEIRDSVDVIMFAADDQGTQNGPILPPAVFADLYAPYYRQMTDALHQTAPQLKVFLHCCGAIYPLLDHIIAAGFDVLGPVQWCAGKQGYREWKEKCSGRIALWGGGVNMQRTLPLGTVEDVQKEVAQVVPVLAAGGGFVFCAIHNILAEIDPLKVVAMHRTAKGVRV